MDSEFPLVSIGLPVFNSEKTIVRALESLLSQDYPNLEIIISDNASDDKTVAICRKYAERDYRIQFYLNERNLGISANFQIVFSKAKGKYFMWAASDDFWEPEFIKTLVNELESASNAGVAFCALKREYPDGTLNDIIKFEGKYNPNNLSNLRIASLLLSPNHHIKDLKFNLFIHGLFNYEAIKWIVFGNPKIGERAFLAPLALSYKFRVVDKILFSKTVYEKTYKKRNPNDDYAQSKKGLKYWKYYSKIMVVIAKSRSIPITNKLFVFVILYYISYKFIYKLKKKSAAIKSSSTRS